MPAAGPSSAPVTGGAAGTQTPVETGTFAGSGSGNASTGVGGSSAPLGLPVDPNVGASHLGIRASAGEVLSKPAQTAFDLNALPATAAGAFDPFGFPVERLSMDRANDIVRARGELPLIGHYLFEYRGIPELDADGRIPQDAFAHTDPAAVVRLSARLASGQPLPGWLRLDARGVFSGIPPEGEAGSLEVEVVARDSEGHEARTAFTLELEALREAARAAGARDSVLGLDVDKEELARAKLEAARQAAERARDGGKPGKGEKPSPRSQSFSDQMRVAKAKADPLLDRILAKGQDKARPPR